ncbi:HalOD1 output domain-containing protein [Halostella salina]|uniref:HalOD1 output domain-containing protein n=1 Tax=Halostella salina TaxID=1547897 RepID=UPI000EF7CDBA|nr:HalOD1 output domain-containing protein [Halostella salina]
MSTEEPSDRNADDLFLEVVEEVATREGIDPTQLTPLQETIDVDSLCDVLETADDSVRIEFRYMGYQVVVHGDGTSHVKPSPSQQPASAD